MSSFFLSILPLSLLSLSLLSLDDVLTEQAILKWYNNAHVAKGKSVFLGQMKRMVEWLQTAEEESEEEEQTTQDTEQQSA